VSVRDPRHDILFEPVQIGPKTLRNRFFQVPHSTGFGSDRPGSQARFRATRAEGGWAAVCVEIASIDPESDRNPVPIPARLWDDDDVRNLALVCKESHDHGALVGIELWHSGAHVDVSPSRLPPGAPSQLPSDAFPMSYPRELTVDEIHRLQRLYAAAALRARVAGFDIVYVYGAHGYLPAQFLSPFYNKREDGYGGSLENRARFWLETIALVREAVGDHCAIAVRIGLDPAAGAGGSPDEALEFVQLADRLVDLWDVNTSVIGKPWLDMRPSRIGPEGYQLEWTGRVREVTRKPIVLVERLTNADRMADLVRRGVCDLIGGARPSIADPFLPSKIEQGHADDVRECIGCNVCISRVLTADHIACTQNATAGEEFRRGWNPERFERAANGDHDVLVIGAGPAGMECAIVLGKRGMRRVHLVEASDEIGGVAALTARLPGLGEWRHVLDWRRRQLDKLRNVEVLTGLRLSAAAAREYGADFVVVATGAHWVADGTNHLTHAPIPGAGLAHVLTPEQVLVDPPRGGRVLVYDCVGHLMGVGLAELLASAGSKVVFATPHQVAAPYLDRTFEGDPARKRLHELSVELRTATTLERIERGASLLASYGREVEIPCDAVVLVGSRRSNDALHRELQADPGRLEAVYAIGDCVAPREIAECIFDGHRLAREIDALHPATALPYQRERRVVIAEPVS
jgi:dimethylamine/trimethylamine dehydrogenase